MSKKESTIAYYKERMEAAQQKANEARDRGDMLTCNEMIANTVYFRRRLERIGEFHED